MTETSALSEHVRTITVGDQEYHAARLGPQDYVDCAAKLKAVRRKAMLEAMRNTPLTDSCRAEMLSRFEMAPVSIAELLTDTEGRMILLRRSFANGNPSDNGKSVGAAYVPPMSLLEMRDLLDAMCGEGVTVDPPEPGSTTTTPT